MNYIYNASLNPLKKIRKKFDTSKSIEDVLISFEFEEANYSDRILVLEIIDDAAPAKAIHISSSRLIERSPFFHKLFSNGMRESKQKQVTLRIEASEEVPFINLLRYVYSNYLPTAGRDLLNLLVIADKYAVASCIEECIGLLKHFPTTCEMALLYLDLPPNLAMFKPLIDAAKQLLVLRFRNLRRSKKEVLKLPLHGIQAVLSSDDLRVTSEAEVFDVILKWARKHYPDLEERLDILETHLLYLVRFPFMTTKELMERLQTCYIDSGHSFEIVIRRFKTKAPQRQLRLSSNVASRQFVARACLRGSVVFRGCNSPFCGACMLERTKVAESELKRYYSTNLRDI